MLESRRNGLPAGCPDAAQDFVRHCRRRNVDFVYVQAQERIADGAANDPRFLTVAVEHPKEARDRTAQQRSSIAERRLIGHRVVPGTSLPFSICAGT